MSDNKLYYTYRDFTLVTDYLVMRLKAIRNRIDTVVGIASGGLPLAVLLKNKLDLPLKVITASHYSGMKRKELKVDLKQLNKLTGTVLVVDDIADTGQTLKVIFEYLTKKQITVLTTTLCYKPRSIYKPDYFGETLSNNTWVVFPWE